VQTGLETIVVLKTATFQKMTPEASIEVGEVTARQCEVE
jgi:hypothetical protein